MPHHSSFVFQGNVASSIVEGDGTVQVDVYLTALTFAEVDIDPLVRAKSEIGKRYGLVPAVTDI